MTEIEQKALWGLFGLYPKYLNELAFYTANALLGYHHMHAPPGSFLWRCLANDFVSAVLQADDHNRQNLHHIATYINEELPHRAWGHGEKVDEWLKGGE